MKEHNPNKSFNSKAMDWFEKTVGPFMEKLSTQRHLLSVRNGIIATIPFIIVGSMFLIILNFPLGDGEYLKDEMPPQVVNFLTTIYRFSMGAMGLYAAFGIAADLGKTYGLGASLSGMMGFFAYLVWFDYFSLTIHAMGGRINI